MQEKYDNNTIPAVDLKPDPDFLPFTNDFIFSLVMRDPTLCRELLALALPEEDFGEIKIMKSPNPLIDEPADGAAESGFPADAHDRCACEEVQYGRMEAEVHDIRIYAQRTRTQRHRTRTQ